MGSVGTSILEGLDAYPPSGARTPATPSTAKSPIPSTISRASENGRPLRTVGRGSISSINDH